MTWKEFEDAFEQELINRGIVYKREGVLRAYGHHTASGKHDFKLEGCRINAIELKRIERLSNIGIMWPNSKKQGSIKPHQIKALRKSGKESGILFYEGNTDTYYFMDIATLDKLVIEYGMFKSFGKGILDNCKVDLEDFVKSLAKE